MNVQIKAIIETAIYVGDLDATERFYRDIFGLRVIAKEPGRHVFFQVGTSSVLLAFIAETTLKAGEKTPHGAKGPGHFALRPSPWMLGGENCKQTALPSRTRLRGPRAAGPSISVILLGTLSNWLRLAFGDCRVGGELPLPGRRSV
jgi:catechol 2,3-dioxygenase-like lactoylglutathione lyase family enzyme